MRTLGDTQSQEYSRSRDRQIGFLESTSLSHYDPPARGRSARGSVIFVLPSCANLIEGGTTPSAGATGFPDPGGIRRAFLIESTSETLLAMVRKRKTRKITPQMLKTGPLQDPRKSLRVGRNEPCPCGSGRKYKDCHQSKGVEFLQKLLRQQEREKLKREGVPWYKRLLRG